MGEKIKLIFKKSFAKYFLVGIFCQTIDYLTTFLIYEYSDEFLSAMYLLHIGNPL